MCVDSAHMFAADTPLGEAQRLASLQSYEVLDTDPEQAYDDLTRIASEICGTPIALVSLVDSDRQWFKSRVGLEATETPRSVAFCSHAILEPDQVFLVPDSSVDERFHDNPIAVGGPHVRFYAGAPLVNHEGHALGTLCVIDDKPRELSASQLESLRALSRQVVCQLELRKRNANLRELSATVQRRNEELREFTAIATHDLGEPLRKLTALSDLLESDLGHDLPVTAREDLDSILESVGRMDRLVASLQALTRVRTSELSRESLALSDCAYLAIDALSSCFREKNVQVEVDALPEVEGDMALLTKIFQNLIGNAIKFSSGEGVMIHVTCSEADGELIVGVRDDGIGMEPEQAEEVFKPFKRLHPRSEYEGTGIGLAIVRKIVERHGGRIWVEACPREGSHFRFTLAGTKLPVFASAAA